MNNKWKHKVVAKAIRVEVSQKRDQIFLVFEVVDQDLKNLVKKDWLQDVDLKLVDKDLVVADYEENK